MSFSRRARNVSRSCSSSGARIVSYAVAMAAPEALGAATSGLFVRDTAYAATGIPFFGVPTYIDPTDANQPRWLDRAGRFRTLWYVILPQVRGGIAVTTIFVFLNAWNEFLFAVVLSGNTVRPVTIAMFNFVSVEQTLWAKLAAVSVLAMLPVIVLGVVAQKNIVKGLTVGAVKGGGRR